jgi:hypothetical protein
MSTIMTKPCPSRLKPQELAKQRVDTLASPDPTSNQRSKREAVARFPMAFSSNSIWDAVFDLQVKLIRDDIDRARAQDKVIAYLSCPISSRGGGHEKTNSDIAQYIENRLLKRFGERFWVLNPTRYQMQSKEGVGLIFAHAERLGWSTEDLVAALKATPPNGDDYMRMWTQVLVVNRADLAPNSEEPRLGNRFDAFYFVGPNDVHEFFTQDTSVSLTSAIEAYFARKVTTDADFHGHYNDATLSMADWEAQRKDFFRYYAIRASAHFSLGSHDEWNIFKLLNEERDAYFSKPPDRLGARLAGFFDGRQIDPAAAESLISAGYQV